MRTVRGPDGTRYLSLDESDGEHLVRDPTTGEERRLPASDLDPIDDASPLETAALAVDDSVRDLLTAVHDERALGLLLELDERGPTAVTTLLSATDLCESDLHGTVAELRVAGLLDEATVGGRRGYRLTDTADGALAALRDEE